MEMAAASFLKKISLKPEKFLPAQDILVSSI